MATFEVQGPDGKTYEVEGADAQGAVDALKRVLGGDSIHAMPPERPEGKIPLYTEVRSATPAEDAYMQGRIRAGAGTRQTGAENNAAPGFQGMTMNWGDEAVSRVKDWLGIEPYDVSMARFRGELEGRREVAPGQSLAAELGGGALTSGPMVGKVALAEGPTAVRMLKSGLTGMGFGTVSGAGAQEGVENRALGAATGGAAGLALGAAIPGVMGLKNALASRFGLQSAEQMLQPGGAAFEKLLQLVQRDGLSPEQAAAKLQQMGPDAMLLDLGDNVSAAAEAMANAPGRPQSIISEAMRQRFGKDGARVQTALDDAMGPAVNLTQTRDAMIAGKEAEAADLYGKAHAVDPSRIMMDQPLMTLLRHPDVQAASKVARQNIVSQLLLENPDLDPAAVEKLVDARFIDEVDRALRSKTTAAYKSQNSEDLARADTLKTVQQRFRGAADKAIPELKEARNAFAGRAELENAFENGLSVFQRKVRPDQLSKDLADMTDSERGAFQQAGRIALQDIMQQSNNDALAVIKTLGPEWNREKLRLVIGKDAADELLSKLEIEQGFQTTNQRIMQNSRTAARVQALEDLGIGKQQEGLGRYGYAYAYGGLPGVGRQALVRGVDELLGSPANRAAERMREYLAHGLTAKGASAARLAVMLGEATGLPPMPPRIMAQLLLGSMNRASTNGGGEFVRPTTTP